MKKKVLDSPRLKSLRRKKRESLKKKALFFLFALVILLIGLFFLTRWERIRVESINVSGNKVLETEEIKNSVREVISGNYLFLFPKNNFLLLPRRTLSNELKNKFSRMESISVETKGTKTLNVEIEEYEGIYLWCGEEPSTEDCYFLNKEGYIFDKAPYFSGEIYLKFFGALNNLDPIGQYFLKDGLANLLAFRDVALKIGMEPVAFHLDSFGDMNMYLTSGPKVIFKQDSLYQELAENLDTILSTEPFKTDFYERYSSLLYIDLRFGNKVYYKFSE